MINKRIFLSSVQKEFAQERKLLKRFVEENPMLSRFFQIFVFEFDVPATDRKTDKVYLEELARSDVYIGLIGNEYGFEDVEGVSPTEREFDEATRLGLPRLIFVQGIDDSARTAKEQAFLKKISPELIRRRFPDGDVLQLEIQASLDRILAESGAYHLLPFDQSPCTKATMLDIDAEKVQWFLKKARASRSFPMPEDATVEEVMTKLNLLDGDKPNNAGVLLFGKEPQRFLLSSEIKCLYWHGIERIKPIASHKVYRGTLFDMSDQAVDFIMSKLDRRVGVRNNGPTAEVSYEVPEAVVAESINNAIAHRQYNHNASIQIELYSDRIEVFSPGPMHPNMTREKLTRLHRSYPNNLLIADTLYLAQYIEEIGSGTTDIVRLCKDAGLPEPKFEATATDFLITIYRPSKSNTSTIEPVKRSVKRSVKTSDAILEHFQKNSSSSISEIAELLGISLRVVERHVEKLVNTGFLKHIGPKKGGHWEVIAPDTSEKNMSKN